MRGDDVAGRGAPPHPAGEDALVHRSAWYAPIDPANQRRFRTLARHLHSLGPRPSAELLLKLVPNRDPLMARLEGFARFNPQLLAAACAGDWFELRPRRVS